MASPTLLEGPSPVLSVIDRLDGLATIPVTATRVADLVNDPRATADAIAAVLRSDQSLTAKVLKVANSAYYGIPGGVSDVKHAISFLGFNTLHQLVLTVSLIQALTSKGTDALSLRALWLHSLACGALAEIIARRVGAPQPQSLFSCGLLHDIGKVALVQVAGDKFNDAVALARERGIRLQEAEKLVGLPTDELVGARLAERWRFPLALRYAIGHRAFLAGEGRRTVPRNLMTNVDVTALANLLVRRIRIGDPGDNVTPEIDPDILSRLNLGQLDVDSLRDDLLLAIEHSRVLLDLVSNPA